MAAPTPALDDEEAALAAIGIHVAGPQFDALRAACTPIARRIAAEGHKIVGLVPADDRIAVPAVMIHLGLALFLYAYLLALAIRLAWPQQVAPAAAPVRRGLGWLLGLLALTLLSGGFVAGLNAGLVYNTYPLMDGRLVPDGYWFQDPWYLNPFENLAAVQFNHRLLATLTLILATAGAVLAFRDLPRGRVRGAVMGGTVGVVAATVVSVKVAAAEVVVTTAVVVMVVAAVPVDGVVRRVDEVLSLTGPG